MVSLSCEVREVSFFIPDSFSVVPAYCSTLASRDIPYTSFWRELCEHLGAFPAPGRLYAKGPSIGDGNAAAEGGVVNLANENVGDGGSHHPRRV